MTQREFIQRTGVAVSNCEFESINEVYMQCDCDKDEFCALWCKMNYNRVAIAKAKAKKEAHKAKVKKEASCILLKIEKQMDRYNREGEIYKSAVLTEREKRFLMVNDLALDSSFECSASSLCFIIKTNLNCI